MNIGNHLMIYFLSIIFLVSCNTESPSNYVYRENDFFILASQNIYATSFAEIKNINNTVITEIKNIGISPDQIKYIYSGKGTFTTVFDDFDFGALQDVSIWLVSVKNPTVRKEIYYRDEIPLSQKNELRLLSGLADLKGFFTEEENYNLEIQLKFRNFVPQNYDIRFTYSFAIFIN